MRHIYADFIDKVSKPTRYLGGEYMSVNKKAEDVAGRIVLAFPDVYEIGMSHMGTKILYCGINAHEDLWAERCFCPWVDMEQELRTRDLPLVSLESQTVLSEFDVIGFSLQYELSYTNVLTMLDLGGVAIRSADRANDAPLVLAGGPCATHPEPVSDFFDAFFIGEAEEKLAGLIRDFSKGRRAGQDRLELLAELAAIYPIYVPALYETIADEDTGMIVVGSPKRSGVPSRVVRAMIPDLDAYPFPSNAPVPYAEAIFDRAGVEIARGCTEGCRFCQAGMIYRPVRERSPDSIVKSIVDGVDKAGYDETSLTCLSTADYSSITPLVKKVMGEIRKKRVSLSVSSLRAYGLGDEILDEMAQMRISGITFAPEAGTQRMRDVVNKNITQEHIEDSARRVYSRGWLRLKLYFMIGLPTEQDEDVIGIAKTGLDMLEIGRSECGKRAEVTISVSTHVPKPHTPFQWCAQDGISEIRRKQGLLRSRVQTRGSKLKVHDYGTSWVEGVMSRGDRRLSAVIESAWRDGARFDGWTECFDLDRWQEKIADAGLDADSYLATRPVTARLPWDHIDVGLDEGFLLGEYRKALKSRLSPPCGKVRGHLIHHSNVQEAEAETGKLVCYDCGVACDLSFMKSDRLVSLRSLGALEQSPPRVQKPKPAPRKGKKEPDLRPEDVGLVTRRFRLRYAKLGRITYMGHLDTKRVLERLFRRADIKVAYTKGFSPRPNMQFAPALPLGVSSFGELLDILLVTEVDAEALLSRLQEVSPEGLMFTGMWELAGKDRGLSKMIEGYEFIACPASDGRVWDVERLLTRREDFLAKERVTVPRKEKEICVSAYVSRIEVLDEEASAALCKVLDWPLVPALLQIQVASSPQGSARPIEVCRGLNIAGDEKLGGATLRLARLGFLGVAFEEKGLEIAASDALGHFLGENVPAPDVPAPTA
ncbi:MAG: TIGR03960 family B12-binding radical SAM protein [Kofleriaceae bacterium]|nr:TIGR03960 family B12-binding radical SAM protein [Kofleriaceae bacterium]